MSSFKASTLVISYLDTPVSPTTSGDLTIGARFGNLQVFDGITEKQLIFSSDVANVSASIVGSLSLATNSINTLYSTYANSTTVASISAGLNSRITANELLDTQQTNSINTLFSTYANSTTVAAISAGLNSRITANELLDTQQINSINTLYSTYANSTTVASISANLQSQILSSNIILSGGSGITTSLSGNTWIISSISGIQGRQSCNDVDTVYTINHNTIDSSKEYPIVSLDIPTSGFDIFVQGIFDRTNTSFKVVLSGIPSSSYGILWHISTQAGVNMEGYATTSDVNSLQQQNTYNSNSIDTLFSSYANSTTVASISAGLNARLLAISGGSSAWWGKITDSSAIAIGSATTATIEKHHFVSGTSADYTITLPSVTANPGKVIGFTVHNYTLADKLYTLDAGAGINIAGRTRFLRISWCNVVLLYSDGAKWIPLICNLTSPQVDLGAITITGATTDPTKGTRSPDKYYIRREGSIMFLRYNYVQSVANGTAGSGEYRYDLPTSFTILDGNFVPDGGVLSGHYHGASIIGHGRLGNTSTSTGIYAIYQAGSPPRFRLLTDAGTFVGSTNYPLSAIMRFGLEIRIPLQDG